MSYIDLALAATDPVSSVLLGFIYLRLRSLTDRVSRVESVFFDDHPDPQPESGSNV